jgi:hypothetical protein
MSKVKPYTRRVETDQSDVSSVKVDKSDASPSQLLFNKSNYVLMSIGMGLIFLGLLLMSGGKMEDPNVWDESVIYSFRRITLAPIVILSGLVINIYAIFYKK